MTSCAALAPRRIQAQAIAQRERRLHDARRIAQVADGLEQRDDVQVDLRRRAAARQARQPGFLEQQHVSSRSDSVSVCEMMALRTAACAVAFARLARRDEHASSLRVSSE